jgi:uncharacterized protein YjiS (DUF1127 family)
MLEFSQAGYWPTQYQLDLWARRERRRLARAWLAVAVRGVVDGLRAAGALIAARRRRTQPLHTLLRLDDRTLADIGVTRGEIEFAFGGTLRGLRMPRRPVATTHPSPPHS